MALWAIAEACWKDEVLQEVQTGFITLTLNSVIKAPSHIDQKRNPPHETFPGFIFVLLIITRMLNAICAIALQKQSSMHLPDDKKQTLFCLCEEISISKWLIKHRM